jgi:UDP-N-acetylmuramoylalanine--D-glutamate ligase
MQLNNTYLIYGMGKSGTATANAILNAGGSVYIGDDKPISDDYLPNAKRININDNNPLPADLSAIITAPGLPFTHPKPHKIYDLARQFNIPVCCDIELFYRIYGHNKYAQFIAITGTNGKSTVTALTTHLLKQAGFDAFAGGNIGTAMFELPAPSNKPIIYVLEISSYQADLCFDFAPDVIGFLNLTPDHIDRHGSIEGYFNSKMRLFSHLSTHGKAYIAGHELGNLGEFETQALDIANKNNALITLDNTAMTQIQNLIADNPFLRGHHNYLNALTACAMCVGVGCDNFVGLKDYVGLAHRSEFVVTKNNITFVNDSKATNADATRPALHAYKNIYWLAGGVPKAEGIDPLLDKDMINVTHAFFYGQAGEAFLNTAKKHHIPCDLFDNLQDALDAAYNMAKLDIHHHQTILLSPCCASFDAFDNFEHRGAVFKQLVNDLI